MIPELAAAWAIGTIPAAAMAVVYSTTAKRKARSDKTQQIQSNLNKVNRYWSDNQSAVVTLSEQALALDRASQRRAFTVFAVMNIFLSWIGFALLALMYVSANYIAVPRAEKRIYLSRLAKENLSVQDVEMVLMDLFSLR